MMKSIVTTIALVLLVQAGRGQGFYLRGGLGLGLPTASQSIDGSGAALNGSATHSSNDSNDLVTYSLKKATFAPLLSLNAAAGYMFMQNIGLDLGITIGSSNEYSYSENNVLVNNIPSNLTITNKAVATVLINPSLVLRAEEGKWGLHTRMGLLVPVHTKIEQHVLLTNLPGTGAVQTDDYTWEITNKFNLGFSATAGLSYNISPGLQFYGEVNVLTLSVYNKEANLTEVSVDGQGGYLKYIAPDNRKIVYSNSFTAKNGDYYHQPSYSQPFSSFGLQVGFMYHFGNEPKKSNHQAPRGHNVVREKRIR